MTDKKNQMNSICVLLVEDNPDDEYIALWVLKKAGIDRVSVARDGREAIDFIYGVDGAPGNVPDLVILDLQLPKIGGVELLRRFRADSRTSQLPVLVLTSSEDLGDKDMCWKLGIIDFISKPLQALHLRKILSE
jgi:CheY-like chemotaxis protein